MDSIQKKLLEEVADLHEVPQGAYSLRINGSLYGKNSSENIEIVAKEDKPGIDIYVKAGTKNESLHIPVILSQSGLKELVYNDFHIGEDCDVTIVAGCGFHNGGADDSEHSGIHSFFVGKNAKCKQGGGSILRLLAYMAVGENTRLCGFEAQRKTIRLHARSGCILSCGATKICWNLARRYGMLGMR